MLRKISFKEISLLKKLFRCLILIETTVRISRLNKSDKMNKNNLRMRNIKGTLKKQTKRTK